MPDVRSLNARIANNYNLLVYDPQEEPILDPAFVAGAASLFAEVSYPADVLDLGCGTGVEMARVAPQVSGRLVGADLASAAVALARERIEPFAERTKVIHGDILDLEPGALGQFDLIYCIGVIYVTPPEVRKRIVDLVGQCLRPGGILAISYRAGSIPTLRANLYQWLRGRVTSLDPLAAVAAARKLLAGMARQLKRQPRVDMMELAVEVTLGLPDEMLFHEAINVAYEAVRTTSLEQDLAERGLVFAGYLPSGDTGDADSSEARALAADEMDMACGGYRYAVFAKPLALPQARFAARPDLWYSTLERCSGGEEADRHVFATADEATMLTVDDAAVAAMFDRLAVGPCSWADLRDHAGGSALSPDVERKMEANLREMWRIGVVRPLKIRPAAE